MQAGDSAADLLRYGAVLVGTGLMLVCVGLGRAAASPGAADHRASRAGSGMTRLFGPAFRRWPGAAARAAAFYPALAGAAGVIAGLGFLAAALRVWCAPV